MYLALHHFWEQADLLGRSLCWILLLMSLLSWTVLFSKSWMFWRARGVLNELDALWRLPGMQEAQAFLKMADTERLVLPLFEAARNCVLQATTPIWGRSEALADRLTRHLRLALEHAVQRLERGLVVLASIGATAPFVGLLGTVWGIYHALTRLAGAGVVRLEDLLGPVGEALIMTALGLAVAIPAVLAYNALQRTARLMQGQLENLAHDLHAHFGAP